MGRTIGVDVESGINAISTSRDKSQVVAAGRKIFLIYSVEEGGLTAATNLRVGSYNLNYSCNDVVWNTLKDELLATGATNGAVMTWNLNKSSSNKLDHKYDNNQRTVNKVCFHPSEWYILLSGSTEGCVKLFDLRQKKFVADFKDPRTTSVWDIKFSPHEFQYFGAVSDNGFVQLWDHRKPDRFLLNEPAHTEIVFSLDWHPEEKHWFATAGRDKTIKVWHWESHELKLQKRNTLYHIQSVRKIKWRPDKKYHIASCSQVDDSAISVWDIRRPYVPYVVFEEHKEAPTGIEWLDPYVFLSSGKDGKIFQHAFKDAKKPDETSNPVGVAVNLNGDVIQSHRIQSSSRTVQNVRSNSLKPSSRHVPKPMWFRSLEKQAEVSELFETTLVFHELQVDKFSDYFCKLAKGYKLSGMPFKELCLYNAQVAEDNGRYQIAQTWRMLDLFFMDTSQSVQPMYTQQSSASTEVSMTKLAVQEPDKALDSTTREPLTNHISHDTASHNLDSTTGVTDEESAMSDSELDRGGHYCSRRHHKVHGNVEEMGMFLDDVGYDDGDNSEDEMLSMASDTKYTLRSEAFNLRHDIQYSFRPPSPCEHDKSRPDSPALSKMDIEPDMGYLGGSQLLDTHVINQELIKCNIESQFKSKFKSLIKEMLEYYANEGDVQMSVSAYIVLGDKMKGEIPESQLEHWCTSYIELLSRFKLWSVSNEIIKNCEIQSVQELNEQSTTIYAKCNHCESDLTKQAWACSNKKCGQLTNTCSLCHLPVKGLYAWCQGCSHGGHLMHMQEWFSHSRYCPTGCGHECEYR